MSATLNVLGEQTPVLSPLQEKDAEENGASNTEEEDVLEGIEQYNGDTQLKTFTSQASGHSAIFRVEDSKIAKPCNPHEAQIYHMLEQNKVMQGFVPKFYGVMNLPQFHAKVRDFQKEGEFIVLEDITSKFTYSCVMDLKLGKKNYNNSQPKEKQRLRRIKITASTAAKLGFRLSGIRTYRPSLNKYAVRKRSYGNRLTEESFLEALDFFLNDGLRTRVELIPNFIQKLEALLEALKQQDTFDFIASSLLLAYDGDYKDVNQGGRDAEVDVRLIDFDHAVIKEPRNHDDDSGIIAGISSLVDIMQRLLYRTNHSYSFFLLPKLPKNERELNHEDNIKRIDSMPELHATSRNGPIIQGYLQKRGKFLSSFKQRFCLLLDSELLYYDQLKNNLKGKITLLGTSLKLSDKEKTFFLVTKDREIEFRANNDSDYTNWNKAISECLQRLSKGQ